MSRLFAEYLIEKNLMDETSLVQALITRAKSIPSHAEVILEKKLMTPTQLLQTFKIQAEQGCSLFEAARKINLWTSEMQAEVERTWDSVRVPLWEILVRTGVTSVEKITEALDEFITEASHGDPHWDATVKAVPASPASGVKADPHQAILGEHQKRLQVLFNELLVPGEVAGGRDAIADKIRQTMGLLKLIKGWARYSDAQDFEALLVQLEEVFETILATGGTSAGFEELPTTARIGLQALEILSQWGNGQVSCKPLITALIALRKEKQDASNSGN